MNRKTCNVIITIILICMVSFSCGTKSNDVNQKESGEEITYRDMSEYKSVGGCLLPNSVYDYTNVFDNVYDWGEDFKLPFPKPEGKTARVESDGAFTLDYMTKEELTEYFKELEKYGFKSTFYGEGDKELGILYNEKLWVKFQNYSYLKDAQTQDSEYVEDEKIEVIIFTGFVNNPLIASEKVHKMIDESKLLEEAGETGEYFIVPIENETVRKAGYYECIIFSEKHIGAETKETKPWYMVSDGENICLLEEYGYSPYFPSSANYMEKDGKKILVTTSGFYYFSLESSSGFCNDTCMFTYELKNNKFVLTEKNILSWTNGPMLCIGKLVDGEIKLYYIDDYNHKYGFDTYNYRNGMKEMIFFDEEFNWEELETKILE